MSHATSVVLDSCVDESEERSNRIVDGFVLSNANGSRDTVRPMRARLTAVKPLATVPTPVASLVRPQVEKPLTPWDMMDDLDSSLGVTFNGFQRRPALVQSDAA